jgi:hypothetical protein
MGGHLLFARVGSTVGLGWVRGAKILFFVTIDGQLQPLPENVMPHQYHECKCPNISSLAASDVYVVFPVIESAAAATPQKFQLNFGHAPFVYQDLAKHFSEAPTAMDTEMGSVTEADIQETLATVILSQTRIYRSSCASLFC